MGEYIMKVYAMQVTHEMLVKYAMGKLPMPKNVTLKTFVDSDMMLDKALLDMVATEELVGFSTILAVTTPVGEQTAKVGDWLLEVNDSIIGVCDSERFEGLFTPIGVEVDQYVLGLKLTARENEVMALRQLLRAAYKEIDAMKGKELGVRLVEGIVDGLQSS